MLIDKIDKAEFTRREITRGKISYQFDEVSDAELALDVFEIIRINLGGIKVASPTGLLGALTREDFRTIRDILYQYIKYRDGNSSNWKPIIDNGNAPFVGQSPMIHYELVFRAWCVSFLASSERWLRDIGVMDQVQRAFKSLSRSTPTSSESSTQD